MKAKVTFTNMQIASLVAMTVGYTASKVSDRRHSIGAAKVALVAFAAGFALTFTADWLHEHGKIEYC